MDELKELPRYEVGFLLSVQPGELKEDMRMMEGGVTPADGGLMRGPNHSLITIPDDFIGTEDWEANAAPGHVGTKGRFHYGKISEKPYCSRAPGLLILD